MSRRPRLPERSNHHLMATDGRLLVPMALFSVDKVAKRKVSRKRRKRTTPFRRRASVAIRFKITLMKVRYEFVRAQSMFWLPLAPFSRSDNQCSRVPCLPQMVLSLALRWLQTFSCERSASGGSRRASSNRLPTNLF